MDRGAVRHVMLVIVALDNRNEFPRESYLYSASV